MTDQAPKFKTIKENIRAIVDEKGFLKPKPLYEAMTLLTSYRAFGVAVWGMIQAKQLRRRKTRDGDGRTPFEYGPGPEPVVRNLGGRPKHKKVLLGFMAEARLRKAQKKV
jgi:hypothetical protein